MKNQMDTRCPEHVHGWHDPDRHGKCAWCGRKVAPAMPRPAHFDGPSDLATEYGRMYDPDWGTE